MGQKYIRTQPSRFTNLAKQLSRWVAKPGLDAGDRRSVTADPMSQGGLRHLRIDAEFFEGVLNFHGADSCTVQPLRQASIFGGVAPRAPTRCCAAI